MQDSIHIDQKVCPVCASSMREIARHGMARDKIPSYISALSVGLGLSAEHIVSPLLDYQCSECHSVYVDPTLSDHSLNRLYLRHAPLHGAGWAKLTSKLLCDPTSEDEVHQVQKLIIRRFGVPRNYLEVGCPFSGLALFWAPSDELSITAISRIDDEKLSDHGRRKLLRYAGRLDRSMKRFMLHLVRSWIWIRKVTRVRPTDAWANKHSVSVTLLAEYSVNRWSFECRAFGQSCVGLASRSIANTVISRERLADCPSDFFELAGIFNSLDHADRPLDLLKEVSRASRRVVVVGHRLSDAYLQHRFAFADDTLPLLAAKIGSSCEDISSSLGLMSEQWFAFLLEQPRDK